MIFNFHSIDQTIGRQTIAVIDINTLQFELLVDEDSLWSGKLYRTLSLVHR